MTSSNGNIFRVTGPLCGEFTSPGEFPTQRPVTQSFDVSFDLRLNKPLSKQSWGWWFETLSRSLWRHCNVSDWKLLPADLFTAWINNCIHRFYCNIITHPLHLRWYSIGGKHGWVIMSHSIINYEVMSWVVHFVAGVLLLVSLIRAWISNYIHSFQWNIITHALPSVRVNCCWS